MPNPFRALAAGACTPLPVSPHFGQAADHFWRQAEIDALTLAQASRRPLLVRGEAGCGKSQLARAAAAVLRSGEPEVEVIHPRFEAHDLLYLFDAVRRLSDAQLRGEDGRPALDLSQQRYLRRGALWRAFARCAAGQPRPVLLIDEIDKADADLPNALLDVLGNRGFSVPVLEPAPEARVPEPAGGGPLILITTNEERELPAAFVRRCIVLNLNPPEQAAALQQWLMERLRAHRALASVDTEVMRVAVAQVLADREVAASEGLPKVGLAEAVDLLGALATLTVELTDATAQREAQLEWLQRLGRYMLVKHAGQDQARPAVQGDDSSGAGPQASSPRRERG